MKQKLTPGKEKLEKKKKRPIGENDEACCKSQSEKHYVYACKLKT